MAHVTNTYRENAAGELVDAVAWQAVALTVQLDLGSLPLAPGA